MDREEFGRRRHIFFCDSAQLFIIRAIFRWMWVWVLVVLVLAVRSFMHVAKAYDLSSQVGCIGEEIGFWSMAKQHIPRE